MRATCDKSAIAIHNYAGNSYLPTGGGIFWPGGDGAHRMWTNEYTPGRGREQEWGWAFQILPYLEEDNLFRQRIPGEAPTTYTAPSTGRKYFYYPSSDAQVAATPMKIYTCPSRRNPQILTSATYGARGSMDYAGNCGDIGGFVDHADLPTPTPQGDRYYPNHTQLKANMVFGYNGPYSYENNPFAWTGVRVDQEYRLTDFPDGTTYTTLVSEKVVDGSTLGAAVPGDQVGWVGGFCADTIRSSQDIFHHALPPRRDHRNGDPPFPLYAFSNQGFGSAHLAGVNVLFADGSVRQVR